MSRIDWELTIMYWRVMMPRIHRALAAMIAVASISPPQVKP